MRIGPSDSPALRLAGAAESLGKAGQEAELAEIPAVRGAAVFDLNLRPRQIARCEEGRQVNNAVSLLSTVRKSISARCTWMLYEDGPRESDLTHGCGRDCAVVA